MCNAALQVLQHMHEHRYVHRDIKCSNLLIDNYHRWVSALSLSYVQSQLFCRKAQ